MLGRRRLKVGYEQQTVRKMKRMETPSKLRLCWVMKFVSEV